MNSNEMFNREKKASMMADVLFKGGVTVDEMTAASAADWQTVASFAGCKPPNSKETVERVLAMLEQAYADAAAAADDKAEAKWEDQQMEESGSDRCPSRE